MELKILNRSSNISFGGQKEVLANFARAIEKSQVENVLASRPDLPNQCCVEINAFIKKAVDDAYFPKFVANIGLAAKISAKISGRGIIPRMTLPGIARVAPFDKDVFVHRVGEKVQDRLRSDVKFAENCGGIQYQLIKVLLSGNY